jgi:putative MATE family efflux protein
MADNTVRTLMRTTDIVVTATFSPAAIVAIGLADLYARFPLRVGLGLGGGAIALSSQDTGADAAAARDEAVAWALLVGVALGAPFAAVGWLFGPELVGLLGASGDIARLGGTYLGIVFLTAPARHAMLIAARALQGAGDTRTPMALNVVSNVCNVSLSVVLGLGLFGAPRLEIVGVAAATAAANVLNASLLLTAIAGPWGRLGLGRPRDPVIARQLVAVSTPRVAEGLATNLAEFPFNALLLGFGTGVNAGYQVGRRLFQQATAPFSRGYNVAASVMVGQSLGAGDPDRARFEGWSVTALGIVTVGLLGVALAVVAGPLAGLLSDDPATASSATAFARVYGLTGAAFAGFGALSGALQGAGETRIPFLARVSGTFGFTLGASWLLGVFFEAGAVGAYVGVGASFVWMALVAAVGFDRSGWAARAAEMMAERGTAEGDPETAD